jgi:ECF transporter S component (folate family)
MSFLIALEIILTRFLSINLPIVRIGFGFLPVAMSGMLFGPVWAGLGYVVGDILGMLIFPSGAYFPGFTLSAFLTGTLYGIFFYNKEITLKRSFVASITVLTLITVCLNTVWLSIMMGKGVYALLPPRIVEACFMVIVQTVTIPLVGNRIVKLK